MGLPIKTNPKRFLIELDKFTYYIKKENLKWVKYQEHEQDHRCLKLSLSPSYTFLLSVRQTLMTVKELWKISHKGPNLV